MAVHTRIIDGKQVAEKIKQEVVEELKDLRERGIQPGLTVVLMGEDPASQIYVRSKTRTCQELGMKSETLRPTPRTTTAELLKIVQDLNADDSVDGILVQLPLPKHIDEKTILEAIDPSKDVDGFHPVNVGRLCMGQIHLAPCTPMGILYMLKSEGVALEGARAVVVGRSNVVGKPVALLLLHHHATVTICHSRTRNLPEVCRQADILIGAVGRPALITRDFIKEGAVIVDVGVNRISDRQEVLRLFGENPRKIEFFEKKGYALVGDVHPRDPIGIASALTPVPGGVGPLTIAHLMKNTLAACRRRRGDRQTVKEA